MNFLAQTVYAIASLPCLLVTLNAPLTRRCWTKDKLGTYLWINDNFAADLGCTPADLVGRTTQEVWPQCWREIVRIDRLVIEERSDVVGHAEELATSEGVFLAAVTRIPLVDDKGVVVGVAGFYDGLPPGELARQHERQLMLHELGPEGIERVAAGMDLLAEELSA